MKRIEVETVEQFIARGGKVTTLPYGENTEFTSWQSEQRRRSFFGRKFGSHKASKSPWFRRGEGCI